MRTHDDGEEESCDDMCQCEVRTRRAILSPEMLIIPNAKPDKIMGHLLTTDSCECKKIRIEKRFA